MDALTKISSRVSDLTTRKSKTAKQRLEDDVFLPASFIPPTFDVENYVSVPSSHSSASSSPPKENGARNIIPSSIRRFSPFPRSKQPSSGEQNKEAAGVKTEPKSASAKETPKDSKYRKIGEQGGEAEKSSGVWRFKDSAMDRVDRMKKNRQGEYGVQLLEDDQD
ncbi:hypothetical protein PENTCL1PPCAC_28338 [Pristionchus entomophagus]|uniref:Uncharacterized protein n=1 Tax=Pristionchus entomophagus TaxID=358040 RepID=A0AAV5UIF1_9BILA|nr:hypothetical protein PENTCL1PPCAC_28338 [Pristionchus entomophagus]